VLRRMRSAAAEDEASLGMHHRLLQEHRLVDIISSHVYIFLYRFLLIGCFVQQPVYSECQTIIIDLPLLCITVSFQFVI
jgi:hypothetical protein